MDRAGKAMAGETAGVCPAAYNSVDTPADEAKKYSRSMLLHAPWPCDMLASPHEARIGLRSASRFVLYSNSLGKEEVEPRNQI